jgi:hypothetical protein
LLEKACEVDEWSLYYALSEPSDALSGKVPVEVVSAGNMGKVLAALLVQLDIRD